MFSVSESLGSSPEANHSLGFLLHKLFLQRLQCSLFLLRLRHVGKIKSMNPFIFLLLLGSFEDFHGY